MCPKSVYLFSTSRRIRNNPGLLIAFALFLVAFLVLSFIAPAGVSVAQSGTSPWEQGVKVYNAGRCCDGYTVFSDETSSPGCARLIDMNGYTVKKWTAADGIGYLTKPLPGGSIMSFGGKTTETGNITKVLQFDWNNTLTWSFSGWTDIGGQKSAEAHHDFQREGNPVGYYAPGMDPMVTGGKTLVLSQTRVNNPAISWWQLLDPVIYEVGADGKPTGFEWHAIDHFNEMGFNDTAKWMIMWLGGFWGDYLHMNAISTLGPNKWYDAGDARFNPDNIITSSRSANLIMIIDRKTGHIVYRVGPDYSTNTPEGQKLGQIIGQHNAHMIPRGLPGEGNILVFDNGGFAGYPPVTRGYSRVIEFNPVTLDKVWEYQNPNGSFFIPAGDGHLFYSFFISGAQRLPNGNTMITEGAPGRIIEVTPQDEIVWEYTLGPWQALYRAYRVPPEWVPGNPNAYKNWGSLAKQ